jgi:hypothetical protein
MKYFKKVSLAVAVGGGVALALRVLQRFTGFEPNTGLAIPGHPVGMILPVVLAGIAVLLVVLSRKLSGEVEQRPFSQVFYTESPALLTVIVMGVFLLAASGILQLLPMVMHGGAQVALTNGGVLPVFLSGAVMRESMPLGVLSVAVAVCLISAAAACRLRDGETGTVDGRYLLVAVICMVVRVIFMYRMDSVNPVMQAWYIGMLALVCTTFALYQLAGFAFAQGRSDRLAVYGGLAVVLNVAALADAQNLSDLLFYAGCAAIMAGFCQLYHEEKPSAEEA